MPAERPAAVFLNQGAGSAGSWRVRRAVELTCAALEAELHVTASRDPERFAAWISERLGDNRTIVVAGGDGSLAGAYNAAAGRDVAIGYIPAGTGNATAHLLRLPRDPVTLAAILAGGDARDVDLVDVEGRLALFAGVGWDGRVAGRYARLGARGLAGWVRAITRSVPDLARPPAVRIEVDGQSVHDGPIEMLVVGTTPWYGRGLLVNPGAAHDAGRLTARVYAGPAPGFAGEALRWMIRRPPRSPAIPGTAVHVVSATAEAIAAQADGDPLGSRREWHFAVRPGAARLIGRWKRSD